MRRDIKSFPIPYQMRNMRRDVRGYPIPVMVISDKDGKPLFAVNDEATRQQCIRKGLCSICGNPLFRMKWFVGGPLSAFHPHGGYLDPAMHHECATYALQVCPYLAAPRYGTIVGMQTLKHAKLAEGELRSITDDGAPDESRPQLFVLVGTLGFTATRDDKRMGGYDVLFANKPLKHVECWLHGERISDDEGHELAQAILKTHDAKPQ